MNGQQSFSDMEYANRKRKTKREEFLEIMDEVIPWDEWDWRNPAVLSKRKKRASDTWG